MTNNRWQAVLTKKIPSWMIGLCVAILFAFALAQGARRRSEIATEWNAEDRRPIESLDSCRELWSLLDPDTQSSLLKSRERFVQISREARITYYPEFSAAMNEIANMKVMQGEYDVAMPLYEEARKNLKKYLKPEHPDAIQIEKNIAQARTLRDRP